MADTVSVTQKARDAAADVLALFGYLSGADQVRRGLADDRVARLASTQPAPAFPREEVTEAIRQAKVKADKVHGVAWYNLEEISRVELILAALLQGKQP